MSHIQSEIHYQEEAQLSTEEFISILERSGLAARRPVIDHGRISSMLQNANIIITARLNGILIGVARSVSDLVYCTYLSDLAVDRSVQKMGIGRELIRQTKRKTPNAKLILLSAPAAIDYYPRIGMTRHEFCFFLDEEEALK